MLDAELSDEQFADSSVTALSPGVEPLTFESDRAVLNDNPATPSGSEQPPVLAFSDGLAVLGALLY